MKFGIKVLESSEFLNTEPMFVGPGETYIIETNESEVIIMVSPTFDGVSVCGIKKM